MLTHAKSSPDINNYLAYIFSNRPILDSLQLSNENIQLVRSAAAINLKNSIKTTYRSIPEADQIHIRNSALSCLEDSNSQIRNFAGTVITEIFHRGGIRGWPELVPELLSLASNDRRTISPAAQEGAMGALAKICEDNKTMLDRDYEGQRPLVVLIPKLLDITKNSNAKVRALSLASINALIPQKSHAVLGSVSAILDRLFQLSNDPSDDVRRNVCRSFTYLVDVEPSKVRPHMQGLVSYMIQQQRNTDDPDLALDAAEFWLCIGENATLCGTLAPHLNQIIPVLLESMVYAEDDVLRLEGYADDADSEDRPEDIKPQFAKSKSARTASNGLGTRLKSQSQDVQPIDPTSTVDLDELSEGELEDAEDDRAEGDPEDQWNLRKCSAAALDVLASAFHQPVFDVTLPYLKENIHHQDWPNREAAVLAIGAIADGCYDAITPHLPDLVPYLISLLSDPEPVVRQITCWSLGRYSYWASHLDSPTKKRQFFEPMMDGILNRMLDNNKRVQEAAASAFANLEEKATKELTPYCAPIVQQFVQCFDRYKDRNMFILYDCVQTLAEHVGPALAQPQIIQTLMPAIILRWNKISDQSRELFPLLECLSFVANALGHAFLPFTPPIFARCIRIVHQNLAEYASASGQPVEKPDKDFLVTSLDLLSAIVQALKIQSGSLLDESQPRFFDLLIFCMGDPRNDVRQSAYALLGDCAVHTFPKLQPFLPAVLPVLVRQLDLENVRDEDVETGFSVINNACWSCGEIAMGHREGMVEYVEKLYQRLMIIIGNPEIPVSVIENAVIALGRLGVGCSQVIGPHLAEFAGPFLQIIEPVDDTDEKGDAFLGFNRTIEKNPQAMEVYLLDYFKAGAATTNIKGRVYSQQVHESFQRVSLDHPQCALLTDSCISCRFSQVTKHLYRISQHSLASSPPETNKIYEAHMRYDHFVI